MKFTRNSSCWLAGLGLLPVFNASAIDLYRAGVGSTGVGMAGADVAWAQDSLGAMASNPAALSQLTAPSLTLGLNGAVATGKFTNRANPNGTLNANGVIPEGGFGLPLAAGRITLGLAVIPEIARDANWTYFDTPGGLGGLTSYGVQKHESRMLLLRTALGASIKATDRLSFGASLGLIYNENQLTAPYVFQSQPTLKGAKTLLDLNTSGIGLQGQFGVLYRATDTLQFGLSYKTEAVARTTGDASGNAGVQLALPSVPFQYDARVKNVFPQSLSGGVSWQLLPRWRVAAQVDWFNWAGAFRTLPVRLSNGTSPIINGAVGSTSLNDDVPLNWRDQWSYRLGTEYTLSDSWRLRGGYSYSTSSVPDGTLTPLTAVSGGHLLAFGAGWKRSRYSIDLGYQWNLPQSQSVGVSQLQAGEYSRSTTETSAHWFSLSTTVNF